LHREISDLRKDMGRQVCGRGCQAGQARFTVDG